MQDIYLKLSKIVYNLVIFVFYQILSEFGVLLLVIRIKSINY